MDKLHLQLIFLNPAELKMNQSLSRGVNVRTFKQHRNQRNSSTAVPCTNPTAIQKVRRTEITQSLSTLSSSPLVHIIFIFFFFRRSCPKQQTTYDMLLNLVQSRFPLEKARKSIYEHNTHEHKSNVPSYVRSYRYNYSDMW